MGKIQKGFSPSPSDWKIQRIFFIHFTWPCSFGELCTFLNKKPAHSASWRMALLYCPAFYNSCSISGKAHILQIKYMILHPNKKYCGTASLKIILIHYFYSIKFVFFPFPLYIIVTPFAKRLLKRNSKFSFFQYFVFGDLDFVKGDKSYSCVRA